MIPTRMAAAAGVVAVAVGLLVAACGGGPTPTPGVVATASLSVPDTATPAATDLPSHEVTDLASPVTGVLTHIDATGLSSVSEFTLRLDDGRLVTFRIGLLDNGDQFPPGHLAEHLATSAPVRVYFRREGSDLVVFRLEDGS